MISKSLSRVALVAALGATALPLLSGAAVYSNGSRTATFDVTLKIIADCIIATNTLDFGQTQGVLATAVTGSSTLNVTCTNTTPYNVGLSAGTGTGSTIAARVMSGTGANTSTVGYALTQTSGGANWGNTQGTDTVSGTGTGTLQNLTVHGNIPAQATPQPDTYKSTITATVYF
ncbi:Spore coat protein U (SCPU) domain-containing protein [Duganella sp. CF402]|uniref:Csu type fimbrial protein n=1 Tax=unclassified Duganella TaxID=2636909 RepID=UPI0008C70927|nr:MULTISPECIES: spore coat U domain-containing protein [unclassified Duganella]RZT10950.1 spore coat protein U-like protein [Duganella sp. BK701]SEK88575.1 Spore coat protein U (SCPU) domain-containing protein [Duganella sp. CF402]